MVVSCSAFGCTNRWGKIMKDGKKLHFHRFPFKKPDVLKKWIIAMRRASWQPTYSSFLCSEHFLREDYRSHCNHFLKDDAVPSVFSFPEHLPKREKKHSVISKHPMSEPEPISPGDNVKNKHQTSMDLLDTARITDSEEDSEYGLEETIFDPCFPSSSDNAEEFLKRKLELVSELYERSWKKMKFHQQKCKLYAKQSLALKGVIESLKQINSVPNNL